MRWSIGRGEIGSIGLTLNPQTGELSGTPTKAGTFLFSLKAQAPDSQSRNFALTITPSNRQPVGTEPTTQPKIEAGASGAEGINWNSNPSEHRGQNGQRFTYACPANSAAYIIYGSDVYTDDSSVCTPAVHAGLITFERGGTVTVEIRPGQSSYQGSRRNGVNSQSYRAWSGSFVFVH